MAQPGSRLSRQEVLRIGRLHTQCFARQGTARHNPGREFRIGYAEVGLKAGRHSVEDRLLYQPHPGIERFKPVNIGINNPRLTLLDDGADRGDGLDKMRRNPGDQRRALFKDNEPRAKAQSPSEVAYPARPQATQHVPIVRERERGTRQ